MEVVIFFLGTALLIAAIFLILDTQQSRRVNKVMKDTKGLQPLFMQRAAEQKLSTLNTLLYGNSPLTGTAGRTKLNNDARQTISSQLSVLINQHRSGIITLKAYSNELNELLKKARAVR
jgi:hypothetical protein